MKVSYHPNPNLDFLRFLGTVRAGETALEAIARHMVEVFIEDREESLELLRKAYETGFIKSSEIKYWS